MSYKISQSDVWSETGTPWKAQQLEDMSGNELEVLAWAILDAMSETQQRNFLMNASYSRGVN